MKYQYSGRKSPSGLKATPPSLLEVAWTVYAFGIQMYGSCCAVYVAYWSNVEMLLLVWVSVISLSSLVSE